MNRLVHQSDQLTRSFIKGMYRAAFRNDSRLLFGNVKTPNVLTASVLCFAQQCTAVLAPLQGHLWFTVPLGADGFPGHGWLAGLSIGWLREFKQSQVIGLSVFERLVRC